jgi:Na+-translocating ferredoxin:NAD+ oxidoreductase RnfE subunit
MTWQEALAWANGAGAAVIAGLFIAIVAEYWSAFQALAEKYKVGVYVVLCLVVPLVATALSIATGEGGEWGDVAGTWWPAFYNGLAAAGIGTLFHAWVPVPLRLP